MKLAPNGTQLDEIRVAYSSAYDDCIWRARSSDALHYQFTGKPKYRRPCRLASFKLRL